MSHETVCASMGHRPHAQDEGGGWWCMCGQQAILNPGPCSTCGHTVKQHGGSEECIFRDDRADAVRRPIVTSSVVGPSGPRPGVGRLAEVLREVMEYHYAATGEACECGRLLAYPGALDVHIANLQAAAIVAAIPSLDAEALAELTGGEVETTVAYHDVIGCPERFHPPGSSVGWQCPHPFVEGDMSRVVTPWRSVTSPEENR